MPIATTSSRYGWVIVIALSITSTISYGILYYSFTVFVEPMRLDLGWSKADITGAYSVGVLVSGLIAAAVGRWIDRVGVRRLMTIGSLSATLLMLWWASVSSVLAFYVIWIGIGIASAAVFYEPTFALIFRWFTTQRGRALTLLTFIAGFASVIFIPLSGTLTEALGWRSALAVLAVIIGVVTLPIHAFVLRDAAPTPTTPQAPAPTPPADIYRRADFRWLTVGFTLTLLVISGISVHLVPYLIGRGYEPAVAAGIGGAIGLAALPGRLIFTPLGARVSGQTITAMLFVLQAIGILALNTIPGDLGVWIFVALYGVGFGAITPVRAQLVAETFGAAQYGAISGKMTQIGTLFRALAPIGVTFVFGLFGGYTVPLYLLVVLTLIGTYCIMRAR